ncbi:hypothetical protein HYQ46_011562 [Verticillium longisporum]|nr:hypothetical protein HYQ44_017636 [Verticillium longisporum]KAG7152592.1 hypothetical protein HYQ46_011562 [Verticillium longisporum]
MSSDNPEPFTRWFVLNLVTKGFLAMCLSTRTVGFVGDSGVGKSSLLNSLLDRPGIAKMGNNGVACTCAATEYHYHDRGDFRVEVVLFSQSEIDEQIFELLRAYQNLSSETLGSQDPAVWPHIKRIRVYLRAHILNRGLILVDLPDKNI